MTEGFHRGGTWAEEVAMLPVGWKAQTGLKYPLELTLADGAKKTFKNYKEHHDFIKSLFPSKHYL